MTISRIEPVKAAVAASKMERSEYFDAQRRFVGLRAKLTPIVQALIDQSRRDRP